VQAQLRREPGAFGPQLVIETRGAAGAVFWAKGREAAIPASVLPPEMPVIDTVGAGDAFAGVLATRWAELKVAGALDEGGIRDCMYWAAAAGALACTKRGAAASMPTRAQIVKLLQIQP
jgi:ribokinase